MDREQQELQQLIRAGSKPQHRTLPNFMKIVRKMESIDPAAPMVDIISGIVHLSFYWTSKGRSSEIENLARILDYPKRVPGKLIQDQLRLNSRLRQAFDAFHGELKSNWKLIYRPGDARETNLAHALTTLECYLRSGYFKAWLFSDGGDHMKRVLAPSKLDAHDWNGNDMGDELVAAYKVLQSQGKATLSGVLQHGTTLLQHRYHPAVPAAGVRRPDGGVAMASPTSLSGSPPRTLLSAMARRPRLPYAQDAQARYRNDMRRAQQFADQVLQGNRARLQAQFRDRRQALAASRPAGGTGAADSRPPVFPSMPRTPFSMAGSRAREDLEALRRRSALSAARSARAVPVTRGIDRIFIPPPRIERKPPAPPLSLRPGPMEGIVTIGRPTLTYSVARGDTLWGMAQKAYGDPHLWPRIYQENRNTIGPNPNRLMPDQRLRIPPL